LKHRALESGFSILTTLRCAVLVSAVVLSFFAFKDAGAAQGGGAGGGERVKYFTDRGQFNYASFLLDEGEYDTAAREFDRVIENFPTSPLLAQAQFKKGEAYFVSGRYEEAEMVLRLFIENFRDSPSKGEAGSMILEARRLKRVLKPTQPAGRAIVAPKAAKASAMNAVQVALFDGLDLDGIDSEFARLKDAGVDTVIVRVFHNSGDRFYVASARQRDPALVSGVYFRTSHAPVLSDLLTPLVRSAHGSGLKIFAWMTTRYADYGLEDRADLACMGYDPASGTFSRCRGLDLFNEEAVKHIEALYSDLAEYDIDGILFQDDLVLRHTEGFGPNAARLFVRTTGLRAAPDELYIPAAAGRVHYTPLFWKWASWKNSRLLEVAKRLKAVVREKGPDVKFAINMMYESVTNPPYALAWLSQDLGKAVEQGFDYYSIMAYHRQMSEELNRNDRFIKHLIGRMVEEASRTVGEPKRVLMKVQTIDWSSGEPLSDGEVVGLIRGIRAAGGVSLAVVPYRGDFPFYELADKGGYALLD
jgi:biofilm PGA synthesis lipoprotein PgaB